MATFVLTAVSGWLAALLVGANACFPRLLRATPSGTEGRPSLFRLHYRIGLVIPAATCLHGWLPMAAGRVSGFNTAGLFLATAALFLMLYQVGLGISLASGGARRNTRRLHFWSMTLIVGLAAAHIILNRP